MIKSYLKRMVSIISLFFCTVSVTSAWDVGIASNLIKFETKESVDIRQGKKDPIKVRLKFIDGSIINEILEDFIFKSSDENSLIHIGDDFVIDPYENRKLNITFYKYFRVNNVNYQLELHDDGICEKTLCDAGISFYLEDNYDDFDKNKQKDCYNHYQFNN